MQPSVTPSARFVRRLLLLTVASGLSLPWGLVSAAAEDAVEPMPSEAIAQQAGQAITPPGLPEAAPSPPAEKLVDLDGLAEAFGWDFDETLVTAEKVSDGLYLLFGVGGNVAVSVGEHGTLLVDDQFPQMMPKLKKAIENLGGGPVDFVINTHWHFDHAEGNLTLGPEGAWIVAQEESQKRMSKDHVINLVMLKYGQSAYPEKALPVISYSDRMQFHFNGQDIELLHFGPAHTTGDTAVFFKQANAVHMGDVFNAGYPFIDVDNGGDLDGVIHFCEAVLARVNAETKVLPGHGPIKGRADLVAFIDMLRSVREAVAAQVVEGASLEQVLASKPTAAFDETYGPDPTMLVDRAYTSLKRSYERKQRTDAQAQQQESVQEEVQEQTQEPAP